MFLISKPKNEMKDYNLSQNKTLNISVSRLDDNLKKIINKNSQIKSFFDYLFYNKINYSILDYFQDSFIAIEILTLEPKIFILLLNKNKSHNFSLDHKLLNHLKDKYNRNDKRTFLLFLPHSINSIQDIFLKSRYIEFKQILIKEQFKRIITANVKISIKNELREGLPLGTFSKKNKLNDLTGREWIKFTKSWFVHNPPPRKKLEILHPAKYPESLIEDFIRFFTKKGQIVIDPFLGTGSTAVAAKNTARNCIGIEINKKYAIISKSRLKQKSIEKWMGANIESQWFKIFTEDSNCLLEIWEKNRLPQVDFCITSPPYWNQLKRNSMRQAERKNKGLDTIYSTNPKDIGNLEDYKEFIDAQKKIFEKVYTVLKDRGYLVIITNNVFFKGRVYPLAFDTATSLAEKWVLKDEKVWCQDDKALLPLGINNAWVANRCHQYCLIFRKEVNL